MTSKPAEVLFYHLERQPLERTLPGLLERTLARGWKAVVQIGNEERLQALDIALWTYSEESFLAHGTAKTGYAAEQPIYLTTGDEVPNGAGVRFLVDGAVPATFEGLERIVFLFDGQDGEAVEPRARNGKLPRRRAAPSPTGSKRKPAVGRKRPDRPRFSSHAIHGVLRSRLTGARVPRLKAR
jgi:DNA polymerase-3 subunit chi